MLPEHENMETWTSSMETRTCSMDKQHGYASWTRSMYRTCSIETWTCIFDLDLDHRHSQRNIFWGINGQYSHNYFHKVLISEIRCFCNSKFHQILRNRSQISLNMISEILQPATLLLGPHIEGNQYCFFVFAKNDLWANVLKFRDISFHENFRLCKHFAKLQKRKFCFNSILETMTKRKIFIKKDTTTPRNGRGEEKNIADR